MKAVSQNFQIGNFRRERESSQRKQFSLIDRMKNEIECILVLDALKRTKNDDSICESIGFIENAL